MMPTYTINGREVTMEELCSNISGVHRRIPDGVHRRYYDNGQLALEVPIINGYRHGLMRAWVDNGQLIIEAPHVNGKFHGLEREWDATGQLIGEVFYAHGKEEGPTMDKFTQLIIYGEVLKE